MSRSLTIAASLFLVTLSVSPLNAALAAPVRTASGLVSGLAGADPSVTAFKGIPFAAPPTGDLRWRAPKPPVAWQETRKAEQFSDSCIQKIVPERKPWTTEFMAHNQISEDCLYLNVWTAAKAAADKRPVLVWFHGGGYNEGSTAVPVYDGEELARKGLVVVTVNYRLGLIGYLAHPELSKESGHNASGNYGTLDQIAALHWVRQNIAAFGGDPGRVTIAGQSAGASSVHNMTASPLAKGLFHRAIAESGSAVVANNRVAGIREAEQAGLRFAASKGAQSIQQLRAMSWKDLSDLSGSPTSGFRPVVDGWVLPESLADTFAHGTQNDVPTLTGMTADEGSSAKDYGTIPATEFEAQVQKRFGDLAREFLKLYPATADQSQKTSAREQGMVSMYLWAVNRAKTAKTKAFTYYWNHAEPGPDQARYGAFHTSEVPYVFNTLKQSNRPWTPLDHKLAEVVGAYWVNFVTTADPNGKDLAPWPAFDPKSAVTMEIGDKTAPRPVADQARIAFFARYFTRPDATAR
ncbi:MAG: carboxylesterase family protein [Candidatus Solibacter sp.]|nr:carboxylesterase family protein [Candidatus Solibacter sp.]